jgi:hypothetical protein
METLGSNPFYEVRVIKHYLCRKSICTERIYIQDTPRLQFIDPVVTVAMRLMKPKTASAPTGSLIGEFCTQTQNPVSTITVSVLPLVELCLNASETLRSNTSGYLTIQ